MKFNREKAIQALVDNDIAYIRNDDSTWMEWLGTILECGHIGYTMQSDSELNQECLERDLPLDHYMVADNIGA